jgi:hypothetical protein
MKWAAATDGLALFPHRGLTRHCGPPLCAVAVVATSNPIEMGHA